MNRSFKPASALKATRVLAVLCAGMVASAVGVVLTGRVLDGKTGKPVPNATVSADSVTATLSDSKGHYALDVPAHAHYVRAEAVGMYTAWKTVPPSGDSAICDFGLLNWFTPTIEGRVFDGPGGMPEAGARVYVQGTDAFALTDALGHFIIPLRSPGTYIVSARQRLESGQGPVISELATVTVTAGNHFQHDLLLIPTGPEYTHTRLPVRWSEVRHGFGGWPNGHWNPGQSLIYIDRQDLERAGTLERALSQVPSIVVRQAQDLDGRP